MRRVRVSQILYFLVFCFSSGAAFGQQTDEFESLLASAQQAQARGDFEAAAKFYTQAISVHPEIAELKANLGLMYYQIGEDQPAIDAFRQAIRLKPELFVANLFLGREYLKLKRSSDAIPYLKRASLSRPVDINAQLSLGEAYAGVGRTRLAIASYLRATKIDSRDAEAWYHLGVSYLEQVEADARLLVARHKDSAYFKVLVADNFSERRAFIQAIEDYKKALVSPGAPPGAHASYGFALLNRHEVTDAEREFNTELRNLPGSLMAKLGLARLHLEQGQAERAAEEIKEIWAADGNFVRANVAIFNGGLSQQKCSALQHSLDERQKNSGVSRELSTFFRTMAADSILASTAIRLDTENSPTPASSRHANPVQLYAQGNYQQCSDILSSRLQTLQPSELHVLAFCAYSTGDYGHAFAAASKMSVNATTEAEGLYWDTKSAQRLATEALAHASELDSSSPQLHILLGDVYRQRNFFAGAEQEYRKSLALRPQDTGALFGLALALLADNQLDEAFEIAQAALKDSPDDPELNAVMGEILCARNSFVAAEPYLKKSLNTKPEYIPHVHALLGKVYAQTGRTEQAITELKLALTDDKDGTVHYQIARLYLKVGDSDDAKRAFEVSRRLRSEGLNRATVAMQQGADSESQ